MLIDNLKGINKLLFKLTQSIAKLTPPEISEMQKRELDLPLCQIENIFGFIPAPQKQIGQLEIQLPVNLTLSSDLHTIKVNKILKVSIYDANDIFDPLLIFSMPSLYGKSFNNSNSTISQGDSRNRQPRNDENRKSNDSKTGSKFDVFSLIFPLLNRPLDSNFTENFSFYKPLFPFQVKGVKFLYQTPACLLGDEMGLGKSIQAITAARLLFREGKITHACIICPKAVLTDWEIKIRDWAPELIVIKMSGQKLLRDIYWQTPAHIYICTYETFQRDIDDILKRENKSNGTLKRAAFDLLIMDEIQKIKNTSNKNAKAVRSIKSHYKWGLSGTPLENTVDDLIAACETIKPDIFQGVNRKDNQAIIQAYKPIFLRRKKEEILKDLPAKLTKEVWLELLPTQRAKYDLAEKKGIIDLEGLGVQIKIMHVFELITRLKQICNYDLESTESCKLDYLQEDLKSLSAQGDKALVFSQYPNQTLKQLKLDLAEYNPEIYDGSLTDNVRTKLIDNFQTKEHIRVLLLSLKAGNAGITLTRANYVYHFDLWWNPSLSAQAVDRAHRIGQTKKVFEIILLAEHTIERRIYNILSKKKKLFAEVVDHLSDTEILKNSLNEEEIFGLFNIRKSKIKTK